MLVSDLFDAKPNTIARLVRNPAVTKLQIVLDGHATRDKLKAQADPTHPSRLCYWADHAVCLFLLIHKLCQFSAAFSPQVTNTFLGWHP